MLDHVDIRVTDREASATLLHDSGGQTFFVAPRPWVFGVADLHANIHVDGEHRTNHESLRFDTSARAADSNVSAALRERGAS